MTKTPPKRHPLPPLVGAAWMQEGACIGEDPELFYPPDFTNQGTETRNPNAWRIEEAKAVCARCPVLLECLQYAIENDEQGVWGGTTHRERYAMQLNARKKR